MNPALKNKVCLSIWRQGVNPALKNKVCLSIWPNMLAIAPGLGFRSISRLPRCGRRQHLFRLSRSCLMAAARLARAEEQETKGQIQV